MDVARVIALALNAGSSSLKAALYEVEPGGGARRAPGPRLERPRGLGSG
jgi:acetate kinase